MCIPSTSFRKRKNTSEEPEQETPPTSPPPPTTSNADASPPPPPPPPPPLPPPPLAPAEDDIAQQLPDEDLFDTLSPLDFNPDPISPQPLNIILPSSPFPHSPSKDWSSSTWISKYATPTPLGTCFLPTSEDELIIQRNIDMFFHSIDDDPELIPRVTVDTFFPDETSQHATKPTSPSAKMVGAGIANLGNTCFMSAILQCFTHTVPLVQGLRSCTHATPCGADGFCVVCALREHIDASLASSGGHVVPRRLVDNLSNFSSNFRRYQQEDAHEFMQCALNKLRRCFPDGEDNLVEKVFGGRLISKLRCCNCGHSSDTYEPLIDLSLEMENVNTLQHALESFTKVEKIDEKFTCACCMEDVSMEKQLMLYQTPPVAAFHLKRFKKDGTTVKKINNHVHFTLELDLQLYTSGNRNDDVLLNYDLYAVVVHVGSSPNSGHYFCFVRSAPDKWHKLNDSEVTSVLGDLVLCQQAYILFYARQGTPWFSSIMEGEKPDPKSVSDNVEKDEQKLDCSGGEIDDDPMEGEKPDPKLVSDNVEKDQQKPDCSGGESDDDPMEGEKPDPKSVSDNVEKDEQKPDCSGGESDDDPMEGEKPDPKSVSVNVKKDEQKPDCSGGESDDDPMDAYNDSADVSGEESDTAHTQVPP